MPIAERDAHKLAEEIRKIARSAASEMDLQIKVEKLLDPYIPKIPGIELSRYGQAATKYRGIKDAFHGDLVIEYERPGKLSTDRGLAECKEQLTRYLTQEARKHGALTAC